MTYQPPNYGANSSSGDVRRRIWRFSIECPLNNGHRISVSEQDVVLINGGTEKVLENKDPLVKIFTNDSEVIDLRDRTTDAVLGTTTLGDITNMIYSLGRLVQISRDNAILAQESEDL